MDDQVTTSTNRLSGKLIALVVVLGLFGGLGLVLLHRREPTVESESGDRSADPAGESRGSSDRPARETLNASTVEWSDYFGVKLPSNAAGPRQSAAGLAKGFERSEAGAVLAGIHIMARAESAPGPAVFEPTIREQVIGVDKARLLLNSQNAYEEAKIAEAPGPNGEILASVRAARAAQTSVWAYRIESFDPDAASFGILMRTVRNGGPVYAKFDLTVRWIEGDWRLVAPVNGDFGKALHILEEVPQAYVLLGTAG
jgi:hypothetical protein